MSQLPQPRVNHVAGGTPVRHGKFRSMRPHPIADLSIPAPQRISEVLIRSDSAFCPDSVQASYDGVLISRMVINSQRNLRARKCYRDIKIDGRRGGSAMAGTSSAGRPRQHQYAFDWVKKQLPVVIPK